MYIWYLVLHVFEKSHEDISSEGHRAIQSSLQLSVYDPSRLCKGTVSPLLGLQPVHRPEQDHCVNEDELLSLEETSQHKRR